LPIRLAFEQLLQGVVELGYLRNWQTPWAKSVRTCTCQQLPQVAEGLGTLLKIEGVEPANILAIHGQRAAP